MKTKVMSLKDFRDGLTSIWKVAQKENMKIIVLHHSKPILEVYPSRRDELILVDTMKQQDYEKSLEKGLDFWHKDEDENIFKSDAKKSKAR